MRFQFASVRKTFVHPWNFDPKGLKSSHNNGKLSKSRFWGCWEVIFISKIWKSKISSLWLTLLCWNMLSLREIMAFNHKRADFSLPNFGFQNHFSASSKVAFSGGASVMFMRWMCVSTLWSFKINVVLFSTGDTVQKYFHVRSNLHLIHFKYFQEKILHVEGNKIPKVNLKCTCRFTRLLNLDTFRMVSRIILAVRPLSLLSRITLCSACGKRLVWTHSKKSF